MDNLNNRLYKNRLNEDIASASDVYSNVGGSIGVYQDGKQYLNWISGKGDYGVAGRDHSYALSSLALVNPAAAGAVLGTMATASIIHGIATSNFVRSRAANRRLDKIRKEVLTNGGAYIGGTNIFGFNLGGKKYGGDSLKEEILKNITKFNNNVRRSNIIDSTTGDLNINVNDATDAALKVRMESFVATATSNWYIPENILNNTNKETREIASRYMVRAIARDTISFDDIKQQLEGKSNLSPVYGKYKEASESIKNMGNSIINAYKTKMKKSLEAGKFNSNQSAAMLESKWKKYMQEILEYHLKKCGEITESKEFKKMVKYVDTMSLRVDSQKILESLINSLEDGTLFTIQPNNDELYLMITYSNDMYNHKYKCFFANADIGGEPSFEDYDERALANRDICKLWTVSDKPIRDFKINGYYRINNQDSFGKYKYIQILDIMQRTTVYYKYINNNGITSNMNNRVNTFVIGMDKLKRMEPLLLIPSKDSKHESAIDYFDENVALFESEYILEGKLEDVTNDTIKTLKKHIETIKDETVIAAGRYKLLKDNNTIVDVIKEEHGYAVLANKKYTIDEWNDKDAIPILKVGEDEGDIEYEVIPIDNKYPLTYYKFASSYMISPIMEKTREYIFEEEKVKNLLSKYSLYNNGGDMSLIERGNSGFDESNTLDISDVLLSYTRYLGDKELVKNSDDFKRLIKDNNLNDLKAYEDIIRKRAQSHNESIHSVFNSYIQLNESKINESEDVDINALTKKLNKEISNVFNSQLKVFIKDKNITKDDLLKDAEEGENKYADEFKKLDKKSWDILVRYYLHIVESLSLETFGKDEESAKKSKDKIINLIKQLLDSNTIKWKDDKNGIVWENGKYSTKFYRVKDVPNFTNGIDILTMIIPEVVNWMSKDNKDNIKKDDKGNIELINDESLKIDTTKIKERFNAYKEKSDENKKASDNKVEETFNDNEETDDTLSYINNQPVIKPEEEKVENVLTECPNDVMLACLRIKYVIDFINKGIEVGVTNTVKQGSFYVVDKKALDNKIQNKEISVVESVDMSYTNSELYEEDTNISDKEIKDITKQKDMNTFFNHDDEQCVIKIVNVSKTDVVFLYNDAKYNIQKPVLSSLSLSPAFIKIVHHDDKEEIFKKDTYYIISNDNFKKLPEYVDKTNKSINDSIQYNYLGYDINESFILEALSIYEDETSNDIRLKLVDFDDNTVTFMHDEKTYKINQEYIEELEIKKDESDEETPDENVISLNTSDDKKITDDMTIDDNTANSFINAVITYTQNDKMKQDLSGNIKELGVIDGSGNIDKDYIANMLYTLTIKHVPCVKGAMYNIDVKNDKVITFKADEYKDGYVYGEIDGKQVKIPVDDWNNSAPVVVSDIKDIKTNDIITEMFNAINNDIRYRLYNNVLLESFKGIEVKNRKRIIELIKDFILRVSNFKDSDNNEENNNSSNNNNTNTTNTNNNPNNNNNANTTNTNNTVNNSNNNANATNTNNNPNNNNNANTTNTNNTVNNSNNNANATNTNNNGNTNNGQ
jgi:hypothetical protein